MKRVYSAVITPPEKGKKYYLVHIPDLDLYTQGTSIENAIYMAKDCIGMWGISEEDAARPIPKGKTFKPDIKGNEISTLVDIDFTAYRERNDNRSVRKNCTIPAWLNKKATAKKVNFSSVLQKALVEIVEH